MIRFRNQRSVGIFGATLVIFGALANAWVLSWVFSPNGLGDSTRVLLWFLDLSCVFLGVVLIAFRKVVAAKGFSALVRPLSMAYLMASVTSFTVILVLVLLNVLAIPAEGLNRALANAVGQSGVSETDRERERITGVSIEDRRQLTRESRGWRYAPWVGFREKPRSGKFVNVSPHGFRLTHRKDLELNDDGLRVFVFGGSTTYGLGVKDSETIPAFIQKKLSEKYPQTVVNVFNFGRCYYYSSQEMTLFCDLVRRGIIPDIAIFIDGVNEGQAEPHYTAEVDWMFSSFQNAAPWPFVSESIQRFPLPKLIRRTFGVPSRFALMERYMALAPDEVRDQYVQSKRIVKAVSKQFGVRPYFFIQPVPGYRNEFLHHPLQNDDYLKQYEFTKQKISLMEQTTDGKNSFSMTGLLENYASEPYLDSVHYVANVHELIAAYICDRIELPQ